VAAGLKHRGIRVFYDHFEGANLWGKDLYEHLAWVYSAAAEYCVLFASEAYDARKIRYSKPNGRIRFSLPGISPGSIVSQRPSFSVLTCISSGILPGQPRAKMLNTGFPDFVRQRTGDHHPCVYQGIISAVIDRIETESKLIYLVDGHGGRGVSGGPLWT
jgi:hypothetical protein